MGNLGWEIICLVVTGLIARPAWRRARPWVGRLSVAAFVALAALTSRRLPLKPPRGRRRNAGRHHRRFRTALQLSDETFLAQRYPAYRPPSETSASDGVSPAIE
jgi:hypothetical protein